MSAHQYGIAVAPEAVDPEVIAKAKRWSFSAAYKTKILAEVEAAAGSGNIGEILRREGIYSSTLTGWRKERDAAPTIFVVAFCPRTAGIDSRIKLKT
jgi:hypothetical protein